MLLSVATDSDGDRPSGPTRAMCWGRDDYGQAEVPNDLTAVTEISAGYLHTCALRVGGGIRCWGDNQFGQVSAFSSRLSGIASTSCAWTFPR